MTMGEILFMEKQASDRDQTLLACAAQEPKLLPKNTASKAEKSKGTKAKLQSTAGTMFDGLPAEY